MISCRPLPRQTMAHSKAGTKAATRKAQYEGLSLSG